MARSQTLESNAYDVLGVSPNASAEAIDEAFRQLIDGEGYRVGVPLRGQWLRAHQIKQAYATLGDPAQRRAYDESLKAGSQQAPWPAEPGNNPSLSALLRPVGDEQPPVEPSAAAPAIGSGNDEIEPYVDQNAAWPSGDEPEQAPDRAAEPANDEIAADNLATSPEDDLGRDEAKYGSAKRWGTGAAAALALASLVYFSRPDGTPQIPDSETAAQLPPGAQQANPGTPAVGPAELPSAAEADGLGGEIVPEAPGDSPPVAEGLSEPLDTAGGTETAVPSAADANVASATESQTRPSTEAGPANQGTSASVATSTPADAAAPAAQAPAPPAAQAARPGGGVVQSPAQLVGGGPTPSDNPRGRLVGTVVVQFTVQADGRVSNCGAVRSSGKADLDAFTCRLVEQRMRFKPALDAQGNPVASTAHARYEWGRRRRHPNLLSWIFR